MNGLILAKNSLILLLSTDSGSNTKLIGIEPYNVLLSLDRLYFFNDLEAHVARYDFLADGSDSDSDDDEDDDDDEVDDDEDEDKDDEDEDEDDDEDEDESLSDSPSSIALMFSSSSSELLFASMLLPSVKLSSTSSSALLDIGLMDVSDGLVVFFFLLPIIVEQSLALNSTKT
jgi:hypothetical protein